jgi:hypothetical protein
MNRAMSQALEQKDDTKVVVAQVLNEMIDKVVEEATAPPVGNPALVFEQASALMSQGVSWEQALIASLMRHPVTGEPMSYGESREMYG